MTNTDYKSHLGKWEVFEAAIEGPADGNPFVEQKVSAVFSNRVESYVVDGFYDGDGIYKVRFMPTREGKHTFAIRSTFMTGSVSGSFFVEKEAAHNKGRVHVTDDYHFAYENGEPYRSVGTTAYVWNLQSEEQVEATIESLKESRFNKIRFCIFPKHYIYNFHEPSSYPYEGTPMDSSVLTKENFLAYWGKDNGSEFDHTRFNPAHFARLEYCVERLGEIGVEADIILFHPYDRWGFSCMSREENDLYLRYVINRLSAYRNVWWSLANEWDLIPSKSQEDWNHYGMLVQQLDKYGHLRSIHNCIKMYDHSESWITHASVQRVDLYKGAELTDEIRTQYGKPVVMDEIAYEGNIPDGWGNITAEEMVRRFWETAVRGGYPGHGETYLNEDGILWWSHGTQLHGESWKRAGFLLDIMNEVPGAGLHRVPMEWDSVTGVPEGEQDEEVRSVYLFYYSFMRPSSRTFHIDDTTVFKAEVIDTWNMTVTDAGEHCGRFTVELPAQQYMAVRLTRTGEKAEEAEEITEVPVEVIAEETEAEEIPAEDSAETVEEMIEETEETEEVFEEQTEEEPEEAAEEPENEVTEPEAVEEEDEFEFPEIPVEETVSRSEVEIANTDILEALEEPEEDNEPDLEEIPAILDVLKDLSDYAEQTMTQEIPAEEIPEEEEPEDDIDLTLKLTNEEAFAEADEAEEPEEDPEAEEEQEELDEDDILDFAETEQDIENTISMLKLEATQSMELPVVKPELTADGEGITGELRNALDSVELTDEQSLSLDEVVENSVDEEDELPDLITGKFPIISELTHRLFRSKK